MSSAEHNVNLTLVDRNKLGIQICNYGVGLAQSYQLDQSLSFRFRDILPYKTLKELSNVYILNQHSVKVARGSQGTSVSVNTLIICKVPC